MNAGVVLGVAAVLLTLPILLRGPVFVGHDTREHLDFGRYFAEQFWQGDLDPRWLADMNNGLGSASFFVYPPFPSWVYALLLPVAQAVHLGTWLSVLGILVCGGLAASQWMRDATRKLTPYP